ncbi:hypothetical protein Agub_g14228, partial [Astrephomene gubernaculifera]
STRQNLRRCEIILNLKRPIFIRHRCSMPPRLWPFVCCGTHSIGSPGHGHAGDENDAAGCCENDGAQQFTKGERPASQQTHAVVPKDTVKAAGEACPLSNSSTQGPVDQNANASASATKVFRVPGSSLPTASVRYNLSPTETRCRTAPSVPETERQAPRVTGTSGRLLQLEEHTRTFDESPFQLAVIGQSTANNHSSAHSEKNVHDHAHSAPNSCAAALDIHLLPMLALNNTPPSAAAQATTAGMAAAGAISLITSTLVSPALAAVAAMDASSLQTIPNSLSEPWNQASTPGSGAPGSGRSPAAHAAPASLHATTAAGGSGNAGAAVTTAQTPTAAAAFAAAAAAARARRSSTDAFVVTTAAGAGAAASAAGVFAGRRANTGLSTAATNSITTNNPMMTARSFYEVYDKEQGQSLHGEDLGGEEEREQEAAAAAAVMIMSGSVAGNPVDPVSIFPSAAVALDGPYEQGTIAGRRSVSGGDPHTCNVSGKTTTTLVPLLGGFGGFGSNASRGFGFGALGTMARRWLCSETGGSGGADGGGGGAAADGRRRGPPPPSRRVTEAEAAPTSGGGAASSSAATAAAAANSSMGGAGGGSTDVGHTGITDKSRGSVDRGSAHRVTGFSVPCADRGSAGSKVSTDRSRGDRGSAVDRGRVKSKPEVLKAAGGSSGGGGDRGRVAAATQTTPSVAGGSVRAAVVAAAAAAAAGTGVGVTAPGKVQQQQLQPAAAAAAATGGAAVMVHVAPVAAAATAAAAAAAYVVLPNPRVDAVRGVEGNTYGSLPKNGDVAVGGGTGTAMGPNQLLHNNHLNDTNRPTAAMAAATVAVASPPPPHYPQQPQQQQPPPRYHSQPQPYQAHVQQQQQQQQHPSQHHPNQPPQQQPQQQAQQQQQQHLFQPLAVALTPSSAAAAAAAAAGHMEGKRTVRDASQISLLHMLHFGTPSGHVPLQHLATTNVALLSRELRALSWVGQGGGGAVFQGVWQGAPVAVKFMLAASPAHVDATALEAIVSLAVGHPNVVTTYSFDVTRLMEVSFAPEEGAAGG